MRPALDPRKRVGFRVSAAEINDPLPRATGADRTRLTAFPGQKRHPPKREGALILDYTNQSTKTPKYHSTYCTTRKKIVLVCAGIAWGTTIVGAVKVPVEICVHTGGPMVGDD